MHTSVCFACGFFFFFFFRFSAVACSIVSGFTLGPNAIAYAEGDESRRRQLHRGRREKFAQTHTLERAGCKRCIWSFLITLLAPWSALVCCTAAFFGLLITTHICNDFFSVPMIDTIELSKYDARERLNLSEATRKKAFPLLHLTCTQLKCIATKNSLLTRCGRARALADRLVECNKVAVVVAAKNQSWSLKLESKKKQNFEKRLPSAASRDRERARAAGFCAICSHSAVKKCTCIGDFFSLPLRLTLKFNF